MNSSSKRHQILLLLWSTARGVRAAFMCREWQRDSQRLRGCMNVSSDDGVELSGKLFVHTFDDPHSPLMDESKRCYICFTNYSANRSSSKKSQRYSHHADVQHPVERLRHAEAVVAGSLILFPPVSRGISNLSERLYPFWAKSETEAFQLRNSTYRPHTNITAQISALEEHWSAERNTNTSGKSRVDGCPVVKGDSRHISRVPGEN